MKNAASLEKHYLHINRVQHSFSRNVFMKGMSAKKISKSSSVWWTEVNKSQVTLAFARSETGNEFSAGILDLRFLANQKALLVILLYPFTIHY